MDQTAQLHTQTKTLHQSVWKNRNSGQKKMLQREHKEEAVPTRPNFPPIIIISSSSVACCEWVYVCARMRVLVQSACAARKITPVHTGLWFWRLTCGSVHHCEKHENWEPASHRTSERKERTSELNPQGEHTREAFHSGHFSLLLHCCCMTVRLFILAFLF